MNKFKKGDKVIILTGKDKGKSGVISAMLHKQGKVLVGEINIVKRHTKPNKLNPQGGISQKESPIDISNVAHIDPKAGKATKVGIKILENGRKARYAKISGEMIDS